VQLLSHKTQFIRTESNQPVEIEFYSSASETKFRFFLLEYLNMQILDFFEPELVFEVVAASANECLVKAVVSVPICQLAFSSGADVTCVSPSTWHACLGQYNLDF
jgi:hypothetical protein